VAAHTFRDLWKDDGEILMYETGSARGHGQVAQSTATGLTATGAPGWKADLFKGA